jgi:calcium-dependent protein kinase
VYQDELFSYVVTEMCAGGELFNRIVDAQNISEETIRYYMEQLLSAVAYCHMNRIIHRDLKPENIMLVSPKEDTLKIIDFGASTTFKKGDYHSLKVGSVTPACNLGVLHRPRGAQEEVQLEV